MRIHLLSDLHFEARLTKYRKVDADITIVAGDTCGKWDHPDFQDFATDFFKSIPRPTYLVLGNHDFYASNMALMPDFSIPKDNGFQLNKVLQAVPHVRLLHNTSQPITCDGKDYMIIGTPMWSDCTLYDTQEKSMQLASHMISDFNGWSYIRRPDGLLRYWTIADHVAANKDAMVFLETALSTNQHEADSCEKIVVTHWMPTEQAVSEKFAGNLLNPYFVNDCEHLIAAYQPKLWCFGHTHVSYDGMVGDTRVICNPRGYTKEENPSYDPELVIEV